MTLRLCRAVVFLAVLVVFNGVAMTADGNPIKSASKPYPTFGKLESNDPKFDKLFPAGAKIERLAEGFEWSEGPVWSKDGGFLLFSDIPRNSVFKWKDGEGITLYMKPAGYTGIVDYGKEPGSNANVFSKEGLLTQCEHGDRRISQLAKDGGKRTLVDNYQGKRLNSPNDLVYDSKGNLYFTDPIYGLPLREKNDPRQELPYCGVYKLRPRQVTTVVHMAGDKPVFETLSKPDSNNYEISLVSAKMTRPNGLAFSPDEKILYVANSDNPDKAIWMKFNIDANGNADEGTLFFDASPWAKASKIGAPDGMKVDKDGNLWATGPGGLHIFSPDGKHLGTINPDSGDPISNCNWGDDGSTLYMTVNHQLARIKTNTKGAGW
jgi:gluconolactonase